MQQEDLGLEIAKAAAAEAGKESINKIANVIGGMFPFYGLKYQAVTTYIDEIKKSNLSAEGKMMAIANLKITFKQLKNQTAIAQNAINVAKEGTDFSSNSAVNDEWLERFMDSAKFISDEKIQTLWGNILAKEFEQPNSTPQNIIRILTDISPFYAKIFQNICNLAVVLALEKDNKYEFIRKVIVPYKENNEFFDKLNITFDTINELDTLGLIKFNGVSGYILKIDHPRVHLLYINSSKTITSYKIKEFPTGQILLTRAGEYLSGFFEPCYINGYLDFLETYMIERNVEFS